MAEISIGELFEILKNHPDYKNKWDNGVPPEQALYIRFGKNNGKILSSEVFESKDGLELVVDSDENGIIYGIEIV